MSFAALVLFVSEKDCALNTRTLSNISELVCMPCRCIFLFLFFASSFLHAQNGTWTWMKGSPSANGGAVWGTQGVASPANTPPAVYEPCEWTDLQGNLWIFGGSQPGMHYGALWKYDVTLNAWAWMHGPQATNAAPSYGVMGIPSPSNHPGGRGYGVATWVDLQGNLWLFGGSSTFSLLNDLWKYDISTNQWTWMHGSNISNPSGNFGTLQVPSPVNDPPPLHEICATWTDAAGRLWMYGGAGCYSAMWRFDPANGMWTWMSGTNTTGAAPDWGTQGVAAASNTPGGRHAYSHWKDQQGNFWMFGGSCGNGSTYADMWKYDPQTHLWTWMAGSNIPDDTVTFTQQCTPASAHPAGSYENRACWTDDCGRFWGFGGFGAQQLPYAVYAYVWVFDPATNLFQWITNPVTPNPPGVPGTQGVASTSNYPPGLYGGVGGRDNLGNVWLFGGSSITPSGRYNTLWKYTPDPSCPQAAAPSVSTSSSAAGGCSPFTVQFSSNAPPGSTLSWDFGDPSSMSDTSSAAQPSYTYNGPGTFVATLITQVSGACISGSDTSFITITVDSFPAALAGPDQTICPGDSAQLSASGGAAYSWTPAADLSDPSAANPFASPLQSTSYIVTVSNGVCSDQDTVNVNVFPQPALNTGSSVSIASGDSIALLVIGGISYAWSPAEGLSCINCPDPVASPSVTTTYCVQVGDSNGCSNEVCVQIKVELQCGELFVPSAFSPNGDGQNDVLFVYARAGCLTGLSFMVFDRWGEKVFESSDPAQGWDGSFAAKPLSTGVYVYRLEAEMADGTKRSASGNVSLLR